MANIPNDSKTRNAVVWSCISTGTNGLLVWICDTNILRY